MTVGGMGFIPERLLMMMMMSSIMSSSIMLSTPHSCLTTTCHCSPAHANQCPSRRHRSLLEWARYTLTLFLLYGIAASASAGITTIHSHSHMVEKTLGVLARQVGPAATLTTVQRHAARHLHLCLAVPNPTPSGGCSHRMYLTVYVTPPESYLTVYDTTGGCSRT